MTHMTLLIFTFMEMIMIHRLLLEQPMEHEHFNLHFRVNSLFHHLCSQCYAAQHSYVTYGTAVYIRSDVECTCDPFRWNYNNTEMTVAICNLPGCNNIDVVGIYRSKSKVVFSKLIEGLEHLHRTILTEPQTSVIILGDFNVNFMEVSSEQKALVEYMIKQEGYTQLIKQYTTD